MTKKELKSRRYCFTIHNYTKKELQSFHKLSESLRKHRYIIYGLEVSPETKTKHIQGYIELNNAQRYSFLQSYFNIKRGGKIHKFHIEIANGTAEENKKYISKDGDFYEFGEPIFQGNRTDLRAIKEAVKNNPKDIARIVDEQVENHQQLRYAEGLRPYYSEDRDPSKPPKVFWIFGPTGTGKTSLVYRTFSDICSVSSYDWLGTGYNQNECFLLDDFREFNLSFEQILKLTDRYPYTLFYKGSHIPLNSPYIIFTSPKSIDEIFTSIKEDLKQLKRRVVEINIEDIPDLDKIDLRNLDKKHIWKGGNNYRESF